MPSGNSVPRFLSTDPNAYPSPRALILFLTSTLFISAIILSGCAGVTSAKSNSTSAATNSTNSNPATPNSVLSSALSASPASLNLGNVSVGSTSNQSLTITNSGTNPVTISQAIASGAGFAIGGLALPVSLNPGNTATFTASFTPISTGNASGAASFSGPQLNSAFVVQMTGAGAAVAPSITAQPISISILVGQAATFSVNASGTAPLSYQWYKNGAPITGAMSSSYTTSTEPLSDNGVQFSVVVINSAGNVTSNAATLSVTPAPVAPSIMTQPLNQTIFAGQTVTFSVTASGTAPLSYRWLKNGSAVGANSPSYTTPAETASDNGVQFTVVVSNSAGSVTSNAATLTVNTATPGALTPSTTSLNFGNVTLNTSSALTVTFTNSGSFNITVSAITISGAGYTASGISNGQIITPGQAVTLNVTFAPAASGSVTGSVTIASNASNSPAVVGLSGSGVLAHTAILNWTASTSTVIGYNIYRGTVSGGPYVLANSSLVTGTQYVDSTVLAGQTYYYVATAVASGNVESTDSNQVTATIPTP